MDRWSFSGSFPRVSACVWVRVKGSVAYVQLVKLGDLGELTKIGQKTECKKWSSSQVKFEHWQPQARLIVKAKQCALEENRTGEQTDIHRHTHTLTHIHTLSPSSLSPLNNICTRSV